jgi:hypothetical protein
MCFRTIPTERMLGGCLALVDVDSENDLEELEKVGLRELKRLGVGERMAALARPTSSPPADDADL